MARADSGMPLTAEAQVQIRTYLFGIYGGNSSIGTDFLRINLFSPVSIILLILHSYIHIIAALS
jgi:hypothetical protein